MFRVWQRLLCAPAAALLAVGTASAQHHGGGGGHAGGGHVGGHPGGHVGGVHPGGPYHTGYHGGTGAYHHAGGYNHHYGYGGFGYPGFGFGYPGFGYGYPYGGLGGYGGFYRGGVGASGLYGYSTNPYIYSPPAVLGVPATVPVVVQPVTAGYSPLVSPSPAPNTAVTSVIAPDGAMVTLSGTPADTLTGVRRFTSPPLDPGKVYTYKAWATWTEQGKPVTREKSTDVRAGERVTIDLTKPD